MADRRIPARNARGEPAVPEAVALLAALAYGSAADLAEASRRARAWLADRGCHGPSVVQLEAAAGMAGVYDSEAYR
jgi:hypothetical protein